MGKRICFVDDLCTAVTVAALVYCNSTSATYITCGFLLTYIRLVRWICMLVMYIDRSIEDAVMVLYI